MPIPQFSTEQETGHLQGRNRRHFQENQLQDNLRRHFQENQLQDNLRHHERNMEEERTRS